MTARKIFALLIIGIFVWVISPLLLPLAMGAVFAVLFYPWQEKLERRKIPTSLAGSLLTLAISVLVLLPGAILAFLGTREGLRQLRIWRETPRGTGDSIFEGLANSPGVRKLLERINAWYPVTPEELLHTIEDSFRTIGAVFADWAGGAVSQIPGLVMGLAVMIVSIYFFLVDGKRLVLIVRRNSIYGQEQTERLIHTFAGMCRSVILATVASGFAQSVVFTLACLALGVGNVALIGFLVFLCSFIPLIGSAPVTLAVSLHMLTASGDRTTGIILLVMAGAVAVLDNVIRPIVLKGAANLHPLLAFVAAFGGLQVMGFLGVFLGPIIAGLCVATVQNLMSEPRVRV